MLNNTLETVPFVNSPNLACRHGQPWQMVAVDILQVPLSTNNNKYLLVLQDHFTKWAEAYHFPNETASCTTIEMIKFFCTYMFHSRLSILIKFGTLRIHFLLKFSYLLLYGRDPPTYQLSKQVAYDSLSYPTQIQASLEESQDFVHANIAQAASNQKSGYDQHTLIP